MTAAALLPLCLFAASPAAAGTPTQQITVDVRGPVALVEVLRALSHEDAHPGGEWVLDVALPEGARLVDASVRDGERHGAVAAWLDVPRAEEPSRAPDIYAKRLAARGFAPTREPYDDATTTRFRVARTAGDTHEPIAVRYRFSLAPALANGRWRVRFPASPERLPVPADVRVTAAGATDLQIAGAPPHRGSATRVPASSGWEISWLSATGRSPGDAPTIAGTLATSAPHHGDAIVAAAIEVRPGRPRGPAPNVLLLIDRSRSVGLAGASAERDLARKLLEALPPSTRFDGLFFDQDVSRLFPTLRPATREAMAAIDAELLPDRLRNGTDLPGALKTAGDLLRRDAAAYAPRVLIAIMTDGALPDGRDATAAALDHALGVVPGVDVQIAAWVVRPLDDENAPDAAVQSLRGLAAARGGLARELRANELDAVLAPALAALAVGGDVADVRLTGDHESFSLAKSLMPGEGRAGVFKSATARNLVGVVRGIGLRATPTKVTVPVTWLTALLPGAPEARALVTENLVALVEVASPSVISGTTPVKGSLDRDVVRNTLALAYLPRARACYLSRSGATPGQRDLAGRVRLDIDLSRGEVGRVVVESSTLASPSVEACLREGALALDVPRALRNDFPVTARLNLVFRPRTPEKATTADERTLGDQIDLVIEDLHRAQAPAVTESPASDRSMIPTR